MRLPLHYVILAALLAAVGIYFYGHHKGWWERETEMQIEIARKNEEARVKENQMVESLTAKDQELRKAGRSATRRCSSRSLARTRKLESKSKSSLKRSTTSTRPLRRPTMLSKKNLLLCSVLSVLAGCASPPPVVHKPAQVPPLPPEIGQKRDVNLTERLTRLLMPSEQPSPPSQK